MEVTHAIGNFHTVAFGSDKLGSLIYDASGTHEVDFYLDDGKDHNQELMVFDLLWDEAIVAFDPLVHYVPVPNVHYQTIPADNTVSYALGSSMLGTGHVIRQHRGLCRINIPWQDDFGPLSDQFLTGLYDDPDIQEAQRLGEHMQPSYVGRNVDIRHGFSWEGVYSLRAGGIWYIDLGLNAGYGLSAREEDGLIEVKNLHARTKAFDGINGAGGPIEDAVRSGLQTGIAQGLEDAIFDRANVVIPFTQNECGLSDPLQSQQTDCFDVAVDSGLADALFTQVLTDAGVDESGWDVEYIADMMVSGLDPKNFSCLEEGGDSHCGFHPVIQNVNIRPTTLELVVSGGESSIATEQQLLFLYAVGVPLLIEELGDGDIDTVDCSQPPSTPGSGTLPLFPQPNASLP